MNVPDINRTILRMHIATIEAKNPIKIIGLLPRGSVGHVFDDDALDFLAEKRPGLDLLGLVKAENDLSDLLGRPVGIVLVSGLKEPRSRRVSASRQAGMNRSDLDRLRDARGFARHAQDNAGSLRAAALAVAQQPQHAALYKLVIIGETLHRVSAEIETAAPT